MYISAVVYSKTISQDRSSRVPGDLETWETWELGLGLGIIDADGGARERDSSHQKEILTQLDETTEEKKQTTATCCYAAVTAVAEGEEVVEKTHADAGF